MLNMSKFSEAVKAQVPHGEISIDIKSLLPEDFNEKSDEFKEGFFCACVAGAMGGHLVPKEEIN